MNAEDLLLISVGGAAARIVRYTVERSNVPMRALILDTDDAIFQTLTPATGLSTTLFGAKRLNGHGTGGDRSVGAGALRDDVASLQAQIGTPRLVILLTCCGGGTSGAAPQLLDLLRSQGITTITFATAPFSFEGDDRKRNAIALLPALESGTDAFARIPLDGLLSDEQRALPAAETFEIIAQRLSVGLSLLWTLLIHPAFVGFEAEKFLHFLQGGAAIGHSFFFADTIASDEDRAHTALNALIESPRFKSDGIDRLTNAAQVIVGVLAGDDLRLTELETIMTGIRARCISAKETLLGTAFEASRNGTLALIVLAFGSPATDVSTNSEDALKPIRGKRGNKDSSRTKFGTINSRFSEVEPSVYNGQNFDEPTYQRRGIRLAR
ncbi:MAG: hypothetical protein RSD41_04265 [Kiritimatiellia bacterium]